MAVSTAVTVPPPARQPNRFGLFSVVPVHDVSDNHQLLGIQWEPDTCTRPKVLPDQCPCSTVNEFTPAAPIGDASPFSVMGSWTCALAGYSPEDGQAKATRNLLDGEQHAVEWALWTGEADAFAPLDPDQAYHGPRFAHPSTPVIGTVHCARDLLAVIEQYTSHHYVGTPIIHAPRSALSYLDEQVMVTGQRLETKLGVPIVAGAGYSEANTGPDGTRPAVGSYWVYVTGAMLVYRSEVFTPPEATAGFYRCNNEFVALAERTYLAGWDCFTAAVLFTPCCACGEPTGVETGVTP